MSRITGEPSIETLLTIGENIVIEFKRAGDGPRHDTYESICAFLNRNGGDVLLGVTDDGEVVGVPPKSARDMVPRRCGSTHLRDVRRSFPTCRPKASRRGSCPEGREARRDRDGTRPRTPRESTSLNSARRSTAWHRNTSRWWTPTLTGKAGQGD